MKLSDLNPEDVQLVSKPKSTSLKLSELNPEDVQLQVRKPEEPKLEVSQAEALGRGLAEAATMGWSGEATAFTQALLDQSSEEAFRDRYNRYKAEQEAREEAAYEQHPITAYGTELVGSIFIPGIGMAKGFQALGKGASGIQKLARAAKIGATAGAIGGAGKARMDDSTLKEAATGAALGAGFGTALTGLGLGTKALVGKFAKGDSILKKPASGIELGMEEYRINFPQLAKELEERSSIFGKDVLDSKRRELGAKLSSLAKEAADAGKAVDKAPYIEKIRQLEETINTTKLAPDELQDLTKLLRNTEDAILGKARIVDVSVPDKTSKVQINRQKAVQGEEVPSTLEQLEIEASNRRIREQQGGTDYIPVEVPDPKPGTNRVVHTLEKRSNFPEGPRGVAGARKGNIRFLNDIDSLQEQFNKTSELHEDYPKIKAALETAMEQNDAIATKMQDDVARLNQAAQDALEPVEYNLVEKIAEEGPNKGRKYLAIESSNRSIITGPLLEPAGRHTKIAGYETIPERTEFKYKTVKKQIRPDMPLSPEDLRNYEIKIGESRASGEYKSELGKKLVQEIDEAVTQGVNKEIPGYEPIRQQYKYLKDGLEYFGIPQDMPLLVKDGPVLPDGTQKMRLNSEVSKKISNWFKGGTDTDVNFEADLKNLDSAVKFFEGAGLDDVAKEIEELKELGRIYNLGQVASEASTLPFNPATGTMAGGLKTIVGGANFASFYGTKLGSRITNATARNIGKSETLRELGQELTGTESTPEQKISLSRDLYNLPQQEYVQITQILKQDPATAYIGNQLEKVLASGDKMKRDQAMFLIKSNSKAKELLGVK